MLLAASSEKPIALLIIKYPFHFVYIALNELQSFQRVSSIKRYIWEIFCTFVVCGGYVGML
jgi:hypothetical protein